MNSIVEENFVSFKFLEQKIFAFVCEWAREITRILLEDYDEELAAGRDRRQYRDKGKRKTTIKTVYGEVTYSRRVYETRQEDGGKAYVYLLDETLRMNKIGLFSTNLVEKVSLLAAETPYRVTAETIRATCGQSISHTGAWRLIQKLGERICEEEDHLVNQWEAGQLEGERVVPVLFEEMDGVWLSIQGPDHKKRKKQEMKVCTLYEGWEARSRRSRLVHKTVLAGMEKSREFHQKREAIIEEKYAVDEIGQRVLNGDGGSWIREPYDPEAVFQLDRFHIYQEIRKRIREKEARKTIREKLEGEHPEDVLEYLRVYADSVERPQEEGDSRSEEARKLYEYLWNNREGLLPYQKQVDLPEPPEGVEYRNLGVQENQNCTVVTLRMKNRRMRWSVKGAEHLGKVLCRKENQELTKTIERFTDGWIDPGRVKKTLEVLSAAKAPKKDGEGNTYIEIARRTLPLREAMRTESRKAFLEAFFIDYMI